MSSTLYLFETNIISLQSVSSLGVHKYELDDIIVHNQRSFHFLALFQEIKDRQSAFMKAFNAGDPKGAALVYDPDGYFMPNGTCPVKGRAGKVSLLCRL